LRTQYNACTVPQLKAHLIELGCKSTGNKSELIDALVASKVASSDPKRRHAAYLETLTASSGVGPAPLPWVIYKTQFNAVDILNRRICSISWPKRYSESSNILHGMISITLVNYYTLARMRGFQGDFPSALRHLAHALAERPR